MARHRFPIRVRAAREGIKSGRRIAITGAVVLAMGAAGAGMALAANGGTGLKVSLSASKGDGASAACNAGNIVLTTGADVSSTFAQARVLGIGGKVLSATEPSFATDHYNAGSPRWVVELANGNSLWGYPPNAGLNGSDFAWTVNNGNSYLPYATAYAAAGAGSTTITSAGIVEDGDQISTTDTITGATFNGEPLICAKG